MWPSFWCHIVVISSVELVDAIETVASWYVFPLSMYKFITIFSAFKTTSAPLMIFKTLFSMRVLQPRSSNYSKDNRFFFKPITCQTPWMMQIIPSYIFILMVPMPTISKAWLSPMYTNPLETGSYCWNHSLCEVMCQVAPESISHISSNFFLLSTVIVSSLHRTSPSLKFFATHP